MADGAFTGEVFVAIARAVDQGTADGFGGDARVGERGLELGIGLGVGFDQVANVVSQLGVILFGGVSPALGVPIETGDPGAQFVEAELDGLSSPAEDAFGLTRVAVEVIASDLGLEPPPFGTGQEPGGLAKGLESVFRERFHGSPRLVKDTGRWTEEIGYGWPESRGRLFCSYRRRSPVGAPVTRSSDLPHRFWQSSLGERPILTPTVQFPIAPRRFHRGQGQHSSGRPTHPLVLATS